MTRLYQYILFFAIATTLFPACVTTRRVAIETLHPAQITFEEHPQTIIINAPHTLLAEAIDSNTTAAGLPADSLIANILYSLKHSWEETLGYENTQFVVQITNDNESHIETPYDLLIRLEELNLRNMYYGNQYGFIEWEAYLYVQYSIKWSIRNSAGRIVDEYANIDMMFFPSGIFDNKAAAVENLPNVKDAWWDLGIMLAQKYYARVAPQWRTDERRIYMVNKFPELSISAHKAMQNNSYAGAFDIWETMLLSCHKKRHKGARSQITYNLAVASEYQNQLEQAISWAKQSETLRQKYRTRYYLYTLRERERQQKILDIQTFKQLTIDN